ncbi:MAG: hypothetical protein ACOYM2_10765 [Rectinemataceae bacterium]
MEFEITIPPDAEGYTGRECPECKKYFKIKFGTGLPDQVPCHCPYCNHIGPQNEFWTEQQLEYARSIVLNNVTGKMLSQLRTMERKPDPNALFSIGITVKGSPTPIAYYAEKDLEQRTTCNSCTLQYAIFGTFAFCPDCGTHNSLQILEANFGIIEKMLDLAETLESSLGKKLIESALENAVSAFDGFGRETCSRLDSRISFQNLVAANDKILRLTGKGLLSAIGDDDWSFILVQFQKRHLIAHKMGVIDAEYVKKTEASESEIGRSISISREDVARSTGILSQMAGFLYRVAQDHTTDPEKQDLP